MNLIKFQYKSNKKIACMYISVNKTQCYKYW